MAESTPDSGSARNISGVPSDAQSSLSSNATLTAGASSIIGDLEINKLPDDSSIDSVTIKDVKGDELLEPNNCASFSDSKPTKKILERVNCPSKEFLVPDHIIKMISTPDSCPLKETEVSQVSDENLKVINPKEEQPAPHPLPSNITLTVTRKNIQQIMCPKCRSTILVPEMATLVQHEKSLPDMHFPAVPSDTQESLNHYWCVDNMFAFENVGFSHATQGIKYLICADCEIGPIGWHDVETKLSYVSPFRISYA